MIILSFFSHKQDLSPVSRRDRGDIVLSVFLSDRAGQIDAWIMKKYRRERGKAKENSESLEGLAREELSNLMFFATRMKVRLQHRDYVSVR